MKHTLIVNLIVSIVLVCQGCGRSVDIDDVIVASPAFDDSLTCVVVSQDSTRLYLGSKQPCFISVDPTSGRRETFPLPDFTDGWKTYDILPLAGIGPQTYLVAKQNCGLICVSYDVDSEGSRRIAGMTQVMSEPSPLPHKGTRFSVYALIDVDSLIIAGTSNGLMYLDHNEIGRLGRDSVATARYAMPLANMRHSRKQFSQESVFLMGDSVLTVTDCGIFKLAVRDFNRSDGKFTTLSDRMRCWYAVEDGDSLAVLWSPFDEGGKRFMTRFSLTGNSRGGTVPVDASTTWIGQYGDSVRCFGPQGNFQCFRAAGMLGGKFYFIYDGNLRVSSPSNMDEGHGERIEYVSDGYGLSNRMGLWRLDDGKPIFLGDVKGISGVRDMSVSGGKMYLAVADGVYSVSLASRLLPYDRRAQLVETNENVLSDRVESVYAYGDTLLIGSRNELHSLVLPTGERHNYDFPVIREKFESLYLQRIARLADGTFMLKTMNNGNWKLRSLKDAVATPAEMPFPKDSIVAAELPERPMMTWKKAGAGIVAGTLVLLAIVGLTVGILVTTVRRYRAKKKRLDDVVRDEKRECRRMKDELDSMLTERKRLEQRVAETEADIEELKLREDRVMERLVGMITSYVKQAVEDSVDGSSFNRQARKCLEEMKQSIGCRGNGDVDMDKVALAYRDFSNFCSDAVAAARSLAEEKIESGILLEPIRDFRNAIDLDALQDLRKMSFARQVEWLARHDFAYTECCRKSAEALSAILSSVVSGNSGFESADLNMIWNEVIHPVVVKNISCDVIDGKIGNNNVNDRKNRKAMDIKLQRTYQLIAVSFFGCVSPDVDGHKLEVRESEMVRFEMSSRCGTIFKFWARHLSSGIMKWDDCAWAARAVDLLWRVSLSKRTEDIPGSNLDCVVTLGDGIRLQFYLIHGETLPENVRQCIKNRRRGRPRTESEDDNGKRERLVWGSEK